MSALECISAWLFILLTGGVPANIFWLRRPPPLLVLCYIAAVSKIQKLQGKLKGNRLSCADYRVLGESSLPNSCIEFNL